MGSKLVLAALMCAALYAQDLKPAIDNEHVTVWNQPGQTKLAYDHDVVVMWLTGPHAGTARFIPKGGKLKDGDLNGARSVVIELKDAPATHYENKTGYPAAFPRPHVKKLFENQRVVVWSYRWTPREPTPMHFHDKDVVVVYREDTALVSTTPDGAKKLNQYKAFDIRFNKGNRTHTELLDHGTGSAMMMELK